MNGIKIESKVHFGRGRRSKKQLRTGEKPRAVPGRVPRVAKLMALAIRFEQLVRDGVVAALSSLSDVPIKASAPAVRHPRHIR